MSKNKNICQNVCPILHNKASDYQYKNNYHSYTQYINENSKNILDADDEANDQDDYEDDNESDYEEKDIIVKIDNESSIKYQNEIHLHFIAKKIMVIKNLNIKTEFVLIKKKLLGHILFSF